MTPDVLDETNAKIAELVGIAEREREKLLEALCSYSPIQWDPDERRAIAELALDYAQWTHLAHQYRGLLRSSSGQPLTVAK